MPEPHERPVTVSSTGSGSMLVSLALSRARPPRKPELEFRRRLVRLLLSLDFFFFANSNIHCLDETPGLRLGVRLSETRTSHTNRICSCATVAKLRSASVPWMRGTHGTPASAARYMPMTRSAMPPCPWNAVCATTKPQYTCRVNLWAPAEPQPGYFTGTG